MPRARSPIGHHANCPGHWRLMEKAKANQLSTPTSLYYSTSTMRLCHGRICGTISVVLLLSMQTSLAFVVTPQHPPPRYSTQQQQQLVSTSDDHGQASSSMLRSMTFCNLDKVKQPQLLCDFLMEIGACSTSIVDADRDTPLEQAIFREPEDKIWLEKAAMICEDAAVGRNVWNRCNVTAHFPASADLQLVATMVSETLEIPLEYNVQAVPNRDWVVHVQQSWKPIMISGLVLRFPWHSQQDVREVVGNSNVMVELQLEGGIAFGTGEHPTTQLCLRWIQTLLEQDATITNVLDYGAGSGVLGLAACAISDRVKAVGVDIDVDAVRIANANAATNVLSMKSYLPPLEETKDSESKSVLMKAHQISNSETLPNDGTLYDACVANILAAPLVTLAPTLASMIKPSGYLGLSGILEPQADMVIEAYSEFFDSVKVENEEGGWILITGKRQA